MQTTTNKPQVASNGSQMDHFVYNSKLFDRIRVLGKGSFGVASVNRRRQDCSLVVLKEIDLTKFRGEEERSLAINEARIMSKLNHSNIIKYYNAYTTESKLIIEMEYASVGTLAAFLTHQVKLFNQQDILVILGQIASGLNYLHSKNIIHLDLKMANIFLTLEGLIKIGDFGIAKYEVNQRQQDHQHEPSSRLLNNNPQKQANLTHHLGTLAYSSPERCIGGETSFKSDIWSLGCILYELVTSKQLFQGDNLPEMILRITRIQYEPIKRTDITPALKELFESMISRQADLRPTAKDIVSMVGQLLIKLQHHHNQYHRQQQDRLVKSKKSPKQSHKYGAGHIGHLNNNHRFDLSTEMALQNQAMLQEDHQQQQSTINYPHSLVYQVKLNSRHIHLDRVNLPLSKRIKEISKGKSHYLVLTYDNVVYAWGSKSHGQLGSCGLSSSNERFKFSRLSARSGSSGASENNQQRRSNYNSNTSSLTSSAQTLIAAGSSTSINLTSPSQSQSGAFISSTTHLNKQFVMSLLKEAQPATKPFVINELNHRKIIQICAGTNFSVFLSKTGIVMTCGDNSNGCLGHGSLTNCFIPGMVESLLNNDVVSISAGPKHVVAVCGNGKVYSWGLNRHGRLGLGKAPLGERCVTSPRQIEFKRSSSNGGEAALYGSGGEVLIKNAFCGDKSTIFIDTENRCWACGENKFNKLGLDSKRRILFSKTCLVDRVFTPHEVPALSKYNIVTCSIGKNHSTFITSEGKLIVLGQDIDHTYKFKRNIISGRDSFRQISSELQTKKLSSQAQKISSSTTSVASNYASKVANNYRQHNHLSSLQMLTSYSASSQKLLNISNNNKPLRQQVDTFLRKSRSIKKMPFECVISVSCTSKFSLALSKDNRVYFWGTRTYNKDTQDSANSFLLHQKQASVNYNQQKMSIEPQLVANCSDECFIKIGSTNSSLMSNIQLMGSDQPIIHAQDPRLTAKTLADLWILDYQPSESDEDGSSQGDQEEGSDNDEITNLKSPRIVRDSTLVRSAVRQESMASSSGSSCCSSSCCSVCENLRIEENKNLKSNCHKHDAILEPQPIVSLYVPSMFNHNGSSLHLVDLFCFDEDRFYLVLDTTVKLHSQQHSSSSSSRPASLIQVTNASQQHHNQGQQQQQQQQQQQMRPRVNSVNTSHMSSHKNQAHQSIDNSANMKAEVAEIQLSLNIEATDERVDVIDQEMIDQEVEPEVLTKIKNVGDDNNNTTDNSESQITEDNVLISSSHGNDLSIDEPRSMSTFAAASHIIVAPTMRASNQDQGHLKVLNFRHHHHHHRRRRRRRYSSRLTNGDPSSPNLNELVMEEAGSASASDQQSAVLASCCDGKNCAGSAISNGCSLEAGAGRRRKLTNKSESTTFTCNEFETSSMPSWVKQEFIQQQQLDCNGADLDARSSSSSSLNANTRQEDHGDDDQEGLFQVDVSSSTEIDGTLMSEISITSVNNEGPMQEGQTDKDYVSLADQARRDGIDGWNKNDFPTSRNPSPSSWSSISLNQNSIPRGTSLSRNSLLVESTISSPLKKFIYFSKSQPDIRDNHDTDDDDLSLEQPRRNSIVLDENENGQLKGASGGSVNHNGNILDCDVYRAMNNDHQISQNNSCTSSRSNRDQLVVQRLSMEPKIQESFDFPTDEQNQSGQTLRMSNIENGCSKSRGFTTPAMSYQELTTVIDRNNYYNNLDHSLATTTASNCTIINLQQKQNGGLALSKSVHQIQRNRSPMLSNGRHKNKTSASSSSLANLRKSFLTKLFC